MVVLTAILAPLIGLLAPLLLGIGLFFLIGGTNTIMMIILVAILAFMAFLFIQGAADNFALAPGLGIFSAMIGLSMVVLIIFFLQPDFFANIPGLAVSGVPIVAAPLSVAPVMVSSIADVNPLLVTFLIVVSIIALLYVLDLLNVIINFTNKTLKTKLPKVKKFKYSVLR